MAESPILVSKCRQMNKVSCGKKKKKKSGLAWKNTSQHPSLLCLAKKGKFHTFAYISRDR